jgi:hypothetical protein
VVSHYLRIEALDKRLGLRGQAILCRGWKTREEDGSRPSEQMPFHARRLPPERGQEKSNCCKQAITLKTLAAGVLSVTGIYRQLRSDDFHFGLVLNNGELHGQPSAGLACHSISYDRREEPARRRRSCQNGSHTRIRHRTSVS